MTILLNTRCRLLGRLSCCLILVLLPLAAADAAGPATTTVADTVYRADGTPAAGTLVIAWNAFTTSEGKAVPAGRTTLKIGDAGAVSIPLVPNFGATPEGAYYKVTYKLDDGTTSEEFWSVPAAPSTTISAIRSKLVPANLAVQYATRQYVDSMLAAGGGGSGNAVKIQGTDVETAEPLRGQSLTFDGAKYKPQSHAVVDVVRDCGATGDGVTNDGPAIQACLDANKGKTILFPQTRPPGSCSYQVSTAAGTSGNDKFGLIMDGHGQRLTGDTHGQAVGSLGNGVTVCFAAGLTGILVPNTNAIAGVPAGNVGCQGCSIENLMLRGSEPFTSSNPLTGILPGAGNTSVNYGTSTGNSQADGIRCAGTYCSVQGVGVQHFGRHGIYLDGNSAAGSFADSSSVSDVVSDNNRGSGLFNRGSDSNATVVRGLKCTGNQLWCVENYSFLGSTFIGGTAHSQHVDTGGAVSSFNISSISRSGNLVTAVLASAPNFARGNAVVVAGVGNSGFNGTFFVASASGTTVTWTQAGADVASSGGTVSNASLTQMWALAANDAVGGCFRSTGGAVTSVFLNPYCEGDNNGRNMINPSTNLIIGGDIGNGFDWANNPPNWITTTTSGMLATPMNFRGRDANGNLQDAGIAIGGQSSANVAAGDNTIFDLENNNPFAAPVGSKAALYFRLSSSADGSGVWGFRCCGTTDSAGLANWPFYMEYGGTTGIQTANAPKAGFPNGFWHGHVGTTTGKLWFGNVNAVANLPTWFTQPIGSIAVNNGAAAGGFAGWIATSAGAPGTYRAFGPIANDATGTSWTLPTLNLTTLSVASTTPVANLTLASDSQLPAITAAGKVAASALPDSQRKRICEVHIGHAGGSPLVDTDDEPVSCFNDFGASLAISAVRCYADAGSPTVQLVRNDSTNILGGSLACGAAAWALADGQSGRPSISASSLADGQWLDVNIVSAGGTAKYLRVVVTLIQ